VNDGRDSATWARPSTLLISVEKVNRIIIIIIIALDP